MSSTQLSFHAPGKSPKIAVIGAGPAGLTAIKNLLEEGLTPIAFEQETEIGGNWRYDESFPGGGGLAYRSLITNTSRRITAFSDFPFPSHLPDFLSRADVLQYLNDYVDHFQLRPFIRLQTAVEHITQAGKQWHVSVRTPAGERETHLFDAVIVASGYFRQPFTPSFPGADTFQGQVIHAIDYTSWEGFEGKQVVVIGNGSSGADIAAEVSQVAASVDLSARTGVWFIPHQVNGKAYDLYRNRFTDLIPGFISAPLYHKYLLSIYKSLGFTDETMGLLQLPEFDPLRARFIPTANVLEKILHGKVRMTPNIARIEAGGVTYTDHSQSPADVLIYSTGYSLGFPFLDPALAPIEGKATLRLYKQVFHPTLDNLAFLAMGRVIGSTFPLAEMQARWCARVFAGKLELPPSATRAQATDQFFAECARVRMDPMTVEVAEYLEDIAALLKVRPQYFKHPDLLQKLWFGPLISAQYRLDGAGKSEQAKAIIISQ